ncbi:hypothetical protein AB0B45_39945 [Nonomuraea sp. NPDC049152]|uniref:hypothetical protein n=1 Tax=Nonomuraea sp. NPDC049152 TaxID=3154350 RepID=UPI0033C7FF9B
MMEAAIILALIIASGAAGVFVVVVIGIHHEDGRSSATGTPPGPIDAGTRRILRLTVDHAGCRYATNEQHAPFDCPTCGGKGQALSKEQ